MILTRGGFASTMRGGSEAHACGSSLRVALVFRRRPARGDLACHARPKKAASADAQPENDDAPPPPPKPARRGRTVSKKAAAADNGGSGGDDDAAAAPAQQQRAAKIVARDVLSYEVDVTSSLELEYEESGDASESAASSAAGAGRALRGYGGSSSSSSSGDIAATAELATAAAALLPPQPTAGLHFGEGLEGAIMGDEGFLTAEEREEPAPVAYGYGEGPDEVDIPEHRVPATAAEEARLAGELDWAGFWERRWAAEAFEDEAWALHHRQCEEGANVFANTRALANVAARVEADDHERGDRSLAHGWPSWARAEHVFAPAWPEFNAYIEANMETLKWRLPPGAEDDDLDVLDDALMFADDDGAGAAASAAAAAAVSGEGAAALDGAAAGAPRGLDSFLVGVLPGVAGGGGMADELFGGGGGKGADDDDLLAAGVE